MRVLVTGGAGFIGSAVIRHIIQHTDNEVVNVDKLTYAGNLESLASVSESNRYLFEKVDICDRSEVERVFEEYQPDAIMHLAAESHVDRSIDSPSDFIRLLIYPSVANIFFSYRMRYTFIYHPLLRESQYSM